MQFTTNIAERGFKVAANTAAMLAYWDKNLVCRFANKAYIEWFGVSPEKMMDKMTLPQLLGPLLYEKNLPHIIAALKGNVEIFEREITLPSGKILHSIATYSPDIQNGEVQGFYVHVSDVTPVKENISNQQIEPIGLTPSGVLYNIDKDLRASLLTGFPGIDQLAKRNLISSSKLKRDFKNHFNTTVFAYYRNLQMEYAHKYLTRNTCSKKQMASMLNFANLSNFSACYKKYVEKKKTQELIAEIKKESEDRYRAFIKETPFSIAMFDDQMRFLAASQKWLDEYHFTDIEIFSKPFYTIFPGTESEWKPMHDMCLQLDLNKADEGVYHRPDGTAVWLRWDIRPWHRQPDVVGGLLIYTEDITEFKNTEEQNKKISGILNKTNEIANIGAWKRNFVTGAGMPVPAGKTIPN